LTTGDICAVYAALAQQEGAYLLTWDRQRRERASDVVEALTPTGALAVLNESG